MTPDPTPSQTPFTSLEAEIDAPAVADPRQTTTRVVRRGRHGGDDPGFLAWPAASSLTFLLSAACLLGGAWTVFASLGIDEGMLAERFGMVGAVHGYELALVVVAVVLCRFQRANPDAIGPVLLGACFLVGSAVTLDLVSIDAPYLTLACGLSGVALMLLKGQVLTRLGGNASPWLVTAPLLLAMGWNLLWPAVMGLYLFHTRSGLASVAWWLPGWSVVLLAAVALVIGIVRDGDLGIDRARPFLRRAALRWTLGLVIIACSGLHLEVLGYLHSLDVTLGEFLPLIALLCLGAVDLRHRAYGPAPQLDQFLLGVPVALTLMAVLREEYGVVSNPYQAWAVFTPALVLAVYAGLVWWLGRQRGQSAWSRLAGAAAVAAVLTWQAAPAFDALNWLAAGTALALGLGIHAVITRRPAALASALMVAASLAALQPRIIHWQLMSGLSPLIALVAVNGLALLLVAALWPRAFRPVVIRLALLALTIGVMQAYGREGSELYAPLSAGCGLFALHAAMAWRTRNWFALTPLLLPFLLVAPSLIPTHKGWLAVWAAFALLGAGVSLSWVRVRSAKRSHPRAGMRMSVPQGVLEG